MHITGGATAVLHSKPRNRLLRWKTDTAGATAVEFALVAIPFFMFIMALVGCAFYFFISNSIERGMDQTTRLIRTGAAVKNKMTVDQFKQGICDGAGAWVDCNQIHIRVDRYTGWDQVDGTGPCADSDQSNSGPVVGTNLIAIYSGTASDVVVVTTCYMWKSASMLPLFKLGNMSDGSMTLRSTTAFRSEPYPES